MNSALRGFYDILHPRNSSYSKKKLHQGPVNIQHSAQTKLGKPALEASYPSPPMSSPPSPPLLARSMVEVEVINPSFHSLSASSLQEPIITTRAIPPISSSLYSEPSHRSTQAWQHSASLVPNQSSLNPSPGTATGAAGAMSTEAFSPTNRVSESQSPQPSVPTQTAIEEASSGTRQSSQRTRPTRRTKAHVASACVNCKRAHLSCDVQRPCTRCVATGKQDSCVDVQHKKRGRPRIREEQEIGRPERLTEAAPTFPTASRQGPEVLAPLQRQTGPGRSLRSYKGEFGSTRSPLVQGMTAVISEAPNFPSISSPAVARSPSHFASSDMPVVLLDLNFVIMKTNSKFRDLISRGNEVRGYPLDHFLAPRNGETIRRLRTELREERQAREPSYLPPIATPGEQGSVETVAEDNLDLITSGYRDRSELLTFRLSSGQPHNTSVRIRLARTSIFFVALVIPPLNNRAQYPGRQQVLETHASASLEKLNSPHFVRPHSPYVSTTRASPLHSFQSLSTSLPPISVSGAPLPLPSPAQFEYSRSHSATPITTISTSMGLYVRSDSEYSTLSMRPDILSQSPPISGSQQPQLPPITGMLPGSRESSEQSLPRQERSQRSGSGTQEREDPNREPKRRRLDISDVLE